MLPDLLSMFLPKRKPALGHDAAGPSGSITNSPEAIANNRAAFFGGWDERLPDGRSVYDAVADAAKTEAGGGFFPQRTEPTGDSLDKLYSQGQLRPAGGKIVPAFNPREPNTYNDPVDMPVQTLGGSTGGAMFPEAELPKSRTISEVEVDPVTGQAMYPGEEKPRASASIEPDPLHGAYERRRDIIQNGAKRQSKMPLRLLSGALLGLSQGMQGGRGLAGGLAGAATGAVGAGFFPSFDRKMRAPYELAQVDQEIAGMEQQRTANTRQRQAETAMENTRVDNEYQRERLGEMKADRERKVGDRVSRERTARMNAVAGMLKNMPAYDPADPKFAELTKALGDVDLPITAKDAKKKIDIKQDQRTGQWTTIVTDTVTGKQEVRDVMKNGKPFASTPTVVMQGEYGLLRQNDQQSYQAEQNQLNRQFTANLEAAKAQHRTALKQFDVANGRAKTLERARQSFVGAFQKANDRPPTEQEIKDYLNALLTDLDNE